MRKGGPRSSASASVKTDDVSWPLPACLPAAWVCCCCSFCCCCCRHTSSTAAPTTGKNRALARICVWVLTDC